MITGIVYTISLILLLLKAPRPLLASTQPAVECTSGALFLGIKQEAHEGRHWSTSGAEVKNEWR